MFNEHCSCRIRLESGGFNTPFLVNRSDVKFSVLSERINLRQQNRMFLISILTCSTFSLSIWQHFRIIFQLKPCLFHCVMGKKKNSVAQLWFGDQLLMLMQHIFFKEFLVYFDILMSKDCTFSLALSVFSYMTYFVFFILFYFIVLVSRSYSI